MPLIYQCDIKGCKEELHGNDRDLEFTLCRGQVISKYDPHTQKQKKLKPFEEPTFVKNRLCEKHQSQFAKLVHDWLKKEEKWNGRTIK